MQLLGTVPIGTIIAAHGVSGLVKVKSAAEDFKALIEKEHVLLAGKRLRCKLRGLQTSVFILEIEGITTRNQAEALKGQPLSIANSNATINDGLRVAELIGLVVIEEGVETGRISALYNFGAGEVVEVKFTNGNTEMFVFDYAHFPVVDIVNGCTQLVRPKEI